MFPVSGAAVTNEFPHWVITSSLVCVCVKTTPDSEKKIKVSAVL